MRRLLVIALVTFALPLDGHAGPSPDAPTAIIAREGALVVTDGSSYFRFEKGGKFRAGPLGMSGRTIDGTWTTDGGSTFTIVGNWSWLNGISALHDLRRMVVAIQPPCQLDPTTTSTNPDAARLRRCYWVVEELVKLPPGSPGH